METPTLCIFWAEKGLLKKVLLGFFDISTVVFVCFLLSLICAYAATDSISCLNVTYLFPGFAQSLSNLLCELLHCSKVYHPQLQQWGKMFRLFGWQQLFWPCYFINIFSLVRNLSPTLFLLGWHWWFFLLGCQQILYTCIGMFSFVMV